MASRNPPSFGRANNRRNQQKSGVPRDQWKSSFATFYRDPASSPSDMLVSSANDPVNPPQTLNPVSLQTAVQKPLDLHLTY